MSIENDILGTKPKLKGINSKRKGNRNELALSKWLSEWTGLQFQRVPASGGLGWKGSVQTIGDLVCTTPDVDFPFTIETKSLKNIGLKTLKTAELRINSCIFKHWEQCEREGKAAGKVPLFFVRDLYMKPNTWWVFMDSVIYDTPSIPIDYFGNKGDVHLIGFNSSKFERELSYNEWLKKLNIWTF